MTTREELYEKFGPLLLESIVRVMKDEINILRAGAGLPERTDEQVLAAIGSKLSPLTEYDWMKDQLP